MKNEDLTAPQRQNTYEQEECSLQTEAGLVVQLRGRVLATMCQTADSPFLFQHPNHVIFVVSSGAYV